MSTILTPDDVAGKLRLSKSTIYKYAERSIIPSFKLGTSLRFFEDEIENYLITIATEQRKTVELNQIANYEPKGGQKENMNNKKPKHKESQDE